MSRPGRGEVEDRTAAPKRPGQAMESKIQRQGCGAGAGRDELPV